MAENITPEFNQAAAAQEQAQGTDQQSPGSDEAMSPEEDAALDPSLDDELRQEQASLEVDNSNELEDDEGLSEEDEAALNKGLEQEEMSAEQEAAIDKSLEQSNEEQDTEDETEGETTMVEEESIDPEPHPDGEIYNAVARDQHNSRLAEEFEKARTGNEEHSPEEETVLDEDYDSGPSNDPGLSGPGLG
ncbi:hypothetical protein [Aeoliella sp.]|uniref:hypothetical protein n=1 Tax=Aeoliella sp. TaxID=2795800 RepID=UPI003CCBCCB7